LTGRTYTTIAHEKGFAANVTIFFNVQLIHFDEAICTCRNKFQSVHIVAINENNERYFVFLNQLHESVAILQRAYSI
jgi:hypothetical protein